MERQKKLFGFPLKLRILNGYWDGLYGAIIKQVDVVTIHNDFWKLLLAFGSDNVVHIHWPTVLYASRFRIWAPFKLTIRLKIIALARLRGDRVIWTVHNYKDHELHYPLLEKIAVWFLSKLANAIIVHTEAGKTFVRERFGRSKEVSVVPHVNYVNFHGRRFDVPDSELMKQLALQSSDKIFMSLGSIRPYKNYEALIDIFNEFSTDTKLIIAGKSFTDEYLSELKARVKTGNVLFYTQSILGDDLPKFFSIARCSVYAFREVLTSGSVILSLSYAVPAIVPDAGDLHYVISDGVNGFHHHNAEELKKIIKRIADMSPNDLHSLQIKTFNDILRYNCDDIARQTLAVYRWG